MGTDASVSVALIVAVVGLLISLYGWANGRKKDTQADDSKLEEVRTSILKANMKLDQICGTTVDIKSDIKSMQTDFNGLDKRVTLMENEIKTAWIRIDELKERVKDE